MHFVLHKNRQQLNAFVVVVVDDVVDAVDILRVLLLCSPSCFVFFLPTPAATSESWRSFVRNKWRDSDVAAAFGISSADAFDPRSFSPTVMVVS